MKEAEITEGMHAGASPVIFQRAKALRDNMTEPEKQLWEFLKKKPLGFKFRRQHPFNKYILDFYCHKVKISIEIDGKSHNTHDQKDRDHNRTEFINSHSITELRFTNEQVSTELKLVIGKIEEALRVASLQGTQGRAEGEKE